jgi:hypothetical protein
MRVAGGYFHIENCTQAARTMRQSLREGGPGPAAKGRFLDFAQTDRAGSSTDLLARNTNPMVRERAYVAAEFQKYNSTCGIIGFQPIRAFIISQLGLTGQSSNYGLPIPGVQSLQKTQYPMDFE